MKKFIAILLTVAMVLSFTAGAVADNGNSGQNMVAVLETKDADIFDALEILKALVNITPNDAELLTGKAVDELSIFDALDILKGLVGMTEAVKVKYYNYYPQPNPQVETGETIQFGGYDWLILDIQDGFALVISENALDVRSFHGNSRSDIDVEWCDSDLRVYLNGEFYNSFSKSDREKIRLSDTDPDWKDYLFLLSEEEIETYMDEITMVACHVDCTYDHVGEALAGPPATGSSADPENPEYSIPYRCDYPQFWWTRTQGEGDNAGLIKTVLFGWNGGYFNDWGYYSHIQGGVRPAMRLDLSGYVKPEEPVSNTGLAWSKELQIKSDWIKFFADVPHSLYEHNVSRLNVYQYLGEYDGREVLMMTDDGRNYKYVEDKYGSFRYKYAEPWQEEVAGVEFAYDDLRRIHVWDDGDFYTLTDAFNADLLTVDDISAIHEKYVENQELFETIRSDFAAKYEYLESGDDIWIDRFYGNYNGSVAVKIEPTTTHEALWSEAVADYTFHYNSGWRIWVWNDGEFYTLASSGNFGNPAPPRGDSGAYDAGLLTADDIRSILFYHSSKVPPKPAYSEFVAAVSDFSVDMFKRAYAEKSGENNLVSPLSALLALSMTANGANWQTLSQMEEVLGRGLSLHRLNTELSSYVNSLPSFPGSKLNIANSIWHKDTFPVSENFLQKNQMLYNAEVIPSPFNPAAVDEINNWVSRNTDDMITEIINEIDPYMVMMLINAIAFDSEWEETYAEDSVWKSNFRTVDGTNQSVDMMYSTENMFISDDKAAGFIKPYKDGAYSFAALLPNNGVDIHDYIADMTGESLMNTLNNAVETEVSTGMPKFKYEFEIQMNGMLKSMGMTDAFVYGVADFSKISPFEDIFISNVLHKTFIEVDEKGTKAAAVTSVEMNCTAVGPPAIILNRPFMYAIIDNATNLPIFIGALTEVPA